MFIICGGSLNINKILPCDLDAERAILGAILLDCAIPADIRATDFYQESHRIIINCMQELADKGEEINLISLKSALQSAGRLEACGGVVYLSSLTDGLPRIEVAPQMLRMIRSKSALRRLIQVGSEVVERAYSDQEDPLDIIAAIQDGCDDAGAILDESTGLVHVGDMVNAVYTEIEGRSNHKNSNAFPTGYYDLDGLLSGGIRPQNQVVVAGRPGSGKTAFMTNMILNMGKGGITSALFELEMSAQEIIERMICVEGRVDGGRMRTGYLTRDDWMNITHAAETLVKCPIYIDDSTGIRVSDMRARIRKAQQKYKIKINICGVDYLQLLSPPERTRRDADENATVSAISRGLKFMAKNLDIGVVAVSQLSRASEKRKDRTPQLSDLRSSGQIEQDADIVMFVYREEMSDPTEANNGRAQIILAKQRNGPTGEVILAYSRQHTAFNSIYREGGSQ